MIKVRTVFVQLDLSNKFNFNGYNQYGYEREKE